MSELGLFSSLVDAIAEARSEMRPGDEMRLCQSIARHCTRESGCECATISYDDTRSTEELVAMYYGVRQ